MPPSPPPLPAPAEFPDSSIDPALRSLPAPTRSSSRPLRRRSSSQPKSYKPSKPQFGSSSSSGSDSGDDDLEFQGRAQGDGEFRLSDLSEIDDEEEREERDGLRREWDEEEEGGFTFGDWNRIGTGGDIPVGNYDDQEEEQGSTAQQGEGGEGQSRDNAKKAPKKKQRDPSLPRPIPTQRKRLLEIAARSSRALAMSSVGLQGGMYGSTLPITSYASGSLPGWEGIGVGDTTAGRGRSCENCRNRKTRCSSHEICESCASRGERCIWKTGTPLYATPTFPLSSQTSSSLGRSNFTNGTSQPQLPPRTYELYPPATYATLVAETSRLRRLANILTNRWCMRESVLASVEGRAIRRCVGMQDVKVEDVRPDLELPIPPPLFKSVDEQGGANEAEKEGEKEGEKDGEQSTQAEPQVVIPDEATKEQQEEGVAEEEPAPIERENTELEDAAILLTLSQPQSQSHSQTQSSHEQSPAPVASTSNLARSGSFDPNSTTTTNDGNEMIDPVLRSVMPPPAQNKKPPQKPQQRTQTTFPQHLAPPFPSSFDHVSNSSPRIRSFSAQDQHQYRPVPPAPTRPVPPQPRARSFSANNQPQRSAPQTSRNIGPPYPPGYRPIDSNHRGIAYHPREQQHPYQSKPRGPSRQSQPQPYPYSPHASASTSSSFYQNSSRQQPPQTFDPRSHSRRPSTINPQALPKFPNTVAPAATTTSKKRASSSTIAPRSITSSTWIAGIPPRGGPSPPLFFPAIPSPSMSVQQQAKNESDRSLEKLRRTHWEWSEKRRTWHEERFERCLLRQHKRETGTPASEISGNKKRKTSNNTSRGGKGGRGKGKQSAAQERSLAIQAAETWATLNAVNQRQAQAQEHAQSVAMRGQRDRERNKLPPIIVPVQPYRSISSSQVGPFRENAMMGGGAMMLGPSSSMLSAMEGPEGSRRSAGSERRFSQWLMSPISNTFNPLPSTSSQPLPSTSSTTNGHDLSSLASAFDHTIPISRPLTPPQLTHRIAIDSPDRSRHIGSPNTLDSGLKPLSELFGSSTDLVDERFEPRLEKDDTFGGARDGAGDGMDWDPFEPTIEARGGEGGGVKEKPVEGGGTQDLEWNSPGRVAEDSGVSTAGIEGVDVAGLGEGVSRKGSVDMGNDQEKGKENVDTREINDAIAALDSIKNTEQSALRIV